MRARNKRLTGLYRLVLTEGAHELYMRSLILSRYDVMYEIQAYICTYRLRNGVIVELFTSLWYSFYLQAQEAITDSDC